MITHLLYEKCKIVRTTDTRGTDGQPIETQVVIGENIPCRLDKGMSKTYANIVRGTMRAEQVAGTLYIDADTLDDTGAPLVIKTNDQITVKGATVDDDRVYEIFMLDKVPGLGGTKHWELGVLNTENA